ncbi:MAG: PstS family phosphate ABC transporter substrate-binding protein [Nitrospinae bacterium]|nr:PstS family phosphate ABC transporter substrate-binding protein [Nitrospinota bacterium]
MRLKNFLKTLVFLFGAILSFGIFNADAASLQGTVRIDGSSTVFPITEAVAEEFQKKNPEVRATVGISGTGGGFKRFCAGDTDINDASRPIKEQEVQKGTEHGIDYIELPVAYDGISVVMNLKNTMVNVLTFEDLKKIWQPESKVKRWNDARPEWPNQPMTLYGPGMDSGTFDYFTEAVNGKAQASRADFTASEDDNVLVQGIAGDVNSLGYFGFSYYEENRTKLKAALIDAGKGPIGPTELTIRNGTYPLSRPIFIYVNKKAADRPEVQAFVQFYLANAPVLVKEVGYIPLPEKIYKLALERFDKRVAGTIFKDKETAGKGLLELMMGK